MEEVKSMKISTKIRGGLLSSGSGTRCG